LCLALGEALCLPRCAFSLEQVHDLFLSPGSGDLLNDSPDMLWFNIGRSGAAENKTQCEYIEGSVANIARGFNIQFNLVGDS
ncbi:MAG: hypothetical protein ABSE49_36075, partial [Polyangiaceae bacterium]